MYVLGPEHGLYFKRNGSPGEPHSGPPVPFPACAEARGLPEQPRRRERVPLHPHRHVFLRSVRVRHHAGLLPLQEEGKEEDKRLHAPGARAGAAGVGRSAHQEAQPLLPRLRLRAVPPVMW